MAKKQRARQAATVRPARPAPVATTGPAVATPVAVAPPPEQAAPAAPAAVSAPPLGWTRRDWWTVAVLVLIGLALYCWRLNTPKGYVFDEVYHAFTAGQIVKGNADAWVWYTTPPPGVAYEWTHPALSKVLIGIGIRIFGDNAVGWRAMSALFGALGIGLIYAMGRTLFNRWVGLVAAFLLLMDGLWFVQSRIAMNDIFLTTFIMTAYFGLFLYLRGPAEATRKYLWLAGAGAACAVATKWSGFYALGLIGAIVLVREALIAYRAGRTWEPRLRRAALSIALMAAVFLVVPAVVYLLAYTQFFTMGHTWSEWKELQRQMWEYHSNLKATHPWQSKWWSWPLLITPVWYYVEPVPGEARSSTIYALGNPLIFWAFIPAIIFAAYSWYTGRFRSAALLILLAGFLGNLLPWVASPRISFLYHMLPSVPFGCLAIAYALSKIREPRVVILGYLLPVLIAFIYFYPIYAALPISQAYLEQHYWFERWRPH